MVPTSYASIRVVMEPARFACVKCGHSLPITSVNVRCAQCDEPFELRYDVPAMGGRSFGATREESPFARYAAFYPFMSIDPSLSLGEGTTTLLRSHRAGPELGLEHLFFKNETENPTWTFKDRGSACSVQHAAALGFARVGTLSSGNMGASIAAFGSRAGMQTVVLLRAGVPREKVDAIAVYQVDVVLVSGTHRDIYEKALEAGHAQNVYFSLADEPMRVEGYKTLAFEIFEQLGGDLPDFVAVPVGSGGLCRGVLKGFEELQAAGMTDRVPTMIGVQSAGCSPIVDAYDRQADRLERVADPQTLDHVLENPSPASGNQLVRKMRAAGGILIKVTNSQIVEAALRLAREGLFAQPASATAFAGVAECARRRRIHRSARIVSVVTGSGLKYPAVLSSYGLRVSEIGVEELTTTLAHLTPSKDQSKRVETPAR
jgi:threonine synthase